ncbi:putative spermidine/putrescine transport system permease protein [Halobacillus dabanensis]|uniref:Putative spermidine/putrescine transport system permease protein n=1 Tax=Halobacillus dabanensis TaxID=240302 RepID=A0A1I3YYE3_HALDA|nr:ABC transporter permease subunit [Halobacillus dabanensis]SFK36845.1 putative spermidine/putrescine transport system permease protein [Halobacillus dabanensis]
MKLFRNKILLLPAFVFLALPFYGFMTAIVQSLGNEEPLSHYWDLLDSDRFLASIAFSIRTAGIATILSIAIGLLLIRSFYKILVQLSPRLRVWIPMLFPHFVWGYMVILLLGESGIFSQIAVVSGWMESQADFPIWTRDRYGIGIIITYVWKEVPLVILLLLPVYSSIRPEYYALVDTLGGNGWNRFTTVELPHLLPVLVESFLIIFSFSLTAYEVPALIGTTFPEMISVLGYEWFYGSSWDDRPLAFASMVSISIFLLILTIIGYTFLNRTRLKAMRGGK